MSPVLIGGAGQSFAMPARSRSRKPKKRTTDPLDHLQRHVAARVRELRLSQDLTQQEVAGRANFDFRYWGKVESGELNPTLKTLGKIALALEVPMCELFAALGSGRRSSPQLVDNAS